MPRTADKENQALQLVQKYVARIPEDLRAILAPESERTLEFAAAIKSLRLKEEERYYVIDIQHRYGIALRPNESVKQTMIRVRLKLLRERREAEAEGDVVDTYAPLPVDPLE